MSFRLPWKKRPVESVERKVADITALKTQLSRKNSDYQSRALAAEHLGHSNNPAAIIPLNTSITMDISPAVKISAAKSLALFRNEAAAVSLGKALIRELKRKKVDPNVVIQIALACGRIGHEKSIGFLETALQYGKDMHLLEMQGPDLGIGDAIKMGLEKAKK
ncbi:MAG: HEAT repeat domain-containing protein [archaeon]|nr:HEAT repeat domain-containing protein [archaeon]